MKDSQVSYCLQSSFFRINMIAGWFIDRKCMPFPLALKNEPFKQNNNNLMIDATSSEHIDPLSANFVCMLLFRSGCPQIIQLPKNLKKNNCSA